MKLPPLPDLKTWLGEYDAHAVAPYMQAYGEACARAMQEEAAKVCGDHWEFARSAAAAIRAIKVEQ